MKHFVILLAIVVVWTCSLLATQQQVGEVKEWVLVKKSSVNVRDVGQSKRVVGQVSKGRFPRAGDEGGYWVINHPELGRVLVTKSPNFTVIEVETVFVEVPVPPVKTEPSTPPVPSSPKDTDQGLSPKTKQYLVGIGVLTFFILFIALSIFKQARGERARKERKSKRNESK